MESGKATAVHVPEHVGVTIVDLDELPEKTAQHDTVDELHVLQESVEFLENSGPYAAVAAKRVAIVLKHIENNLPTP